MNIKRFAILGAVFGALLLPATFSAASAEEEISLPKQDWSFSGPFGSYDKASAQRGFQIYKEVCSACHSMKLGYYRELAGIGLSEAQIKAVAASRPSVRARLRITSTRRSRTTKLHAPPITVRCRRIRHC